MLSPNDSSKKGEGGHILSRVGSAIDMGWGFPAKCDIRRPERDLSHKHNKER